MKAAELDPPQRLRDVDFAERYKITPRLGGEWIRRMIAAGVITKMGRVPVGRLSACDTFVASGGLSPKRGAR